MYKQTNIASQPMPHLPNVQRSCARSQSPPPELLQGSLLPPTADWLRSRPGRWRHRPNTQSCWCILRRPRSKELNCCGGDKNKIKAKNWQQRVWLTFDRTCKIISWMFDTETCPPPPKRKTLELILKKNNIFHDNHATNALLTDKRLPNCNATGCAHRLRNTSPLAWTAP